MLPLYALFVMGCFFNFSIGSASVYEKKNPFFKMDADLCQCYFSDPKSQAILEQAEAFFSAALYEKSLPLYSSLLSLPEKIEKPGLACIYFRLGQIHYFLNQYEKSLLYFEHSLFSEHYVEAHFFAGLAYSQLGQWAAAISKFEQYLNFPDAAIADQAHFECGLAYFHLKRWRAAANQFDFITQNHGHALYILSRFYLARSALQEQDYLTAEAALNAAAPLLKDSGWLRYEWAYLNGELYFNWKDYGRATDWYELALPANGSGKAAWSAETLFKLGMACLRAAEEAGSIPSKLAQYLEKAEQVITALTGISSNEKAYLALAQCHLIKARFQKRPDSYAHAEEILSRPNCFLSRKNQSQVLLLKAQAGATYSARDLLYRQLTNDLHLPPHQRAKAMLFRGLNDFEEAQSLQRSHQISASAKLFEQSIDLLRQAYSLLSQNDLKNAALALKYQACAYIQLKTLNGQLAAFHLFNHLAKNHLLLDHLAEPDEIFYLRGLAAVQLIQSEENNAYQQEALAGLKQGISIYQQGKFLSRMHFLLGLISYQLQDYANAAAAFSEASIHSPDPSLKGDALFWQARSLEKNHSPEAGIKQIKKQIFEQCPASSFAPEAYFNLYSYLDYLNGDRQAIKHLQAFSRLFPNSPYLLNAYYLIGLDFKRDRKTPEGKWISKKNLNSAIDAFQQCEAEFDRLHASCLLPMEKISYYLALRNRATLERALANMAVAEESQGAKRQIYFEYAEDVLREMDNSEQSLAAFAKLESPYAAAREEGTYWLGQICLKQGKLEEAARIFGKMLEKYQGAGITKGYFLSKVCYYLGEGEASRQNYASALENFLRAEDAAKGGILSTDEKLDLWIQQSFCHQQLHQLDETILLLSKVVNEDAVSGLRIKAMCLRADAYSLQGRLELARKQLEAASKYGGEWGLKAKHTLDQKYGYQ